MAAVSQDGSHECPDSIIVSNMPTNMLLADLKSMLLGHFANFGKILRISCASKGKRERTAHIQFSSQDEATTAWKNGKIMNGNNVTIIISSKRPSTQLLTSTPQPVALNLASNTSSSSALIGNNGSGIQTTLAAYFQKNVASTSSGASKTDDKKNIKESISTANSVSNEVSSASSSAPARKEVRHTLVKDNPCVKLEVYQGNSRSLSSQEGAANFCKLPLPPALSSSGTQVCLRPVKSLREILNLDTSNMKIVRTATASDALACRYLMGRTHPFPLAMMFGRIPGNVIMPVKSMMDAIKPGLEIKESTVEFVWNTIVGSVLKTVLPQRARMVLRENILSRIALENYLQLESDVINVEAMSVAEREIGVEEDVLICCEDVLDAMLGLVCSELIENASHEELRSSKAISKAVQCCYRKITGVVISEVVHQIVPDAVLDSLCEEALDDFLESPIFDLHVRVVAAASMKECREERNTLQFCNSSSSLSLSNDGINKTGLDSISYSVPLLDRAGITESWLNSSEFSFNDSQLNDHSSIDTDISCSVGSTQSSYDDDRSSTMLPKSKANNEIVTVEQTVVSEERPADVQTNLQKQQPQQGFLSSLSISSFKRKAAAVWNNISSPTIPMFRYKKRKFNHEEMESKVGR